MNVQETMVDYYLRNLQEMVSDRGVFDDHWQEIAERMYANNANFNYTPSPGEKRMHKIFDSSPTHANQLLAAGLFSLLTSPATPWFGILSSDFRLNQDREFSLWYELATRIMLHEINNAAAGFNTAGHECYMEYGAFGNLTMMVTESLKEQCLNFLSMPLNECYYGEGQGGKVDQLYRKYQRTIRHLAATMGPENLSTESQKLYEENKLDQKVPVAHVIAPRDVYAKVGTMSSLQMPFASVYIDTKARHVMKETGYQELPFMGARFYKSAHEVYGRGPGNTTLPDVKMLMQVAKVTIRAAQKATDPPLLLPDNGFLNPLRTTPGGLNFYRRSRVNNVKDIGQLPTGNPGVGLEYQAHLQAKIREAFFVDQLQLNEGPQMTATEVMQRTEEKLRMMGPLLGRLQTEFLGPLIFRVYGLLRRSGKIPPPPEYARGAPMKIVYTSPIARAQEQVEANGIMRSMEIILPMMDRKPEIADIFNGDEMARGVFDMFSVSQRFLNSQEDVDKVREDRAKMEAAKAEAEVLRDAGQGMAGLSQAGVPMDEDVQGMQMV